MDFFGNLRKANESERICALHVVGHMPEFLPTQSQRLLSIERGVHEFGSNPD